jgi:glycopeptide antibiotics resistance protein
VNAHIKQEPVLRRFAPPPKRERPTRRPKPAVKSTSRSRAKLGLVLLLYCFAVVAVITVAPFQFFVPGTPSAVQSAIVLTTGWSDVIANVFLFVPLGFLFPLTRRAAETSPTRVFALALLTSAVLQATHVFEADRVAAVASLLSNATGAAVGAALLRAVNRRISLSPKLAGRLSLETPLMGLIYLLIPLLVVASLSALDDSFRLLFLLPLGLLGARLIAAVQEFHFAPAGVFRNRTVATIGAGWMMLGIFPVVLRAPLIGGAVALLVGLATWYSLSRPSVHAPDRRFERDVLRSVAPIIATYFLVIAVAPLAAGLDHWRFAIGLTESDGDLGRQMIRALEPFAALTVLGYAIAEARGRRELRFRAVAPRLLVECGCAAIALEACRGFQRGAGASLVQLVLTTGAGLVGARIYHDQRERIRRILIRSRPAPVGQPV